MQLKKMSSFLFLVLFSMITVTTAAQPVPIKIDYTLQPAFKDSQLCLKITGTFQSGQVRSTRLEIPFGYGAQKIFKNVFLPCKFLVKVAG